MMIVAVGWVSLAWAALILFGNAASPSPGPWLPIIASALTCVAYGATLIGRDRRAVTFTWIMVALFGASVLLRGVVPFQLLVWVVFVGFAVYLQRHRSALKAK